MTGTGFEHPGEEARLEADWYELQAGRIGREQEAFDLWRRQYSHELPHEGLTMVLPVKIYRNSERTWIGTPDEAMDKRKVIAGS